MTSVEPKIMFDPNKHECTRHAVASMDTAIFAIAFFCSICGKQLPAVESSQSEPKVEGT